MDKKEEEGHTVNLVEIYQEGDRINHLIVDDMGDPLITCFALTELIITITQAVGYNKEEAVEQAKLMVDDMSKMMEQAEEMMDLEYKKKNTAMSPEEFGEALGKIVESGGFDDGK